MEEQQNSSFGTVNTLLKRRQTTNYIKGFVEDKDDDHVLDVLKLTSSG